MSVLRRSDVVAASQLTFPLEMGRTETQQ